jgi:hypothetical protein
MYTGFEPISCVFLSSKESQCCSEGFLSCDLYLTIFFHFPAPVVMRIYKPWNPMYFCAAEAEMKIDSMA